MAAALSAVSAAARSEPTLAVLRRDREAIARSLTALSERAEGRIAAAAQHTLAAGGKRWRPLLTCSVMRALGEDPAPVMELAAAVELVHVGSLLHDDVLDASPTRRGRVAAHLAFDAHTAILAGDCLLSWTLERLARDAPRPLLVALTRAIASLTRGEVLERERRGDHRVDVAHVRTVHELKTAALFAYAAEAGAILAWADAPTRAAARAYGTALGLAFQAADDLLDWVGDEATVGKALGHDLADGLVNLPLALACARDPLLKDSVAAFWATHAARTPQIDLQYICARLAAAGALDAARVMAEVDVARAVAALDALPPSPWRDQLAAGAARALVREV